MSRPVAVSTFSGTGGSTQGMKRAGFDVVWANEFVPFARETYLLNHGLLPDARDIRNVTPDEIASHLPGGIIDLLEGSPPCASFSLSGNREADWAAVKKYSDTEQRTDDLFWEFARLVEGLQPKVFIAENVPAMAKGKAYGYFLEIHKLLQECGYVVEARILDSAWLGVPQTRKRLFLQGVRNDLKMVPVWPKPHSKRISVIEALPWLEATGIVCGPPLWAPECVGDPQWLGDYALLEHAKLLRPGESSEERFNLSRAHPSLPSPTITARYGAGGAAAVIHPWAHRKFSLYELRVLCGFPPEWRLTGNYERRCERLGRAVPPPVMRAIASIIRSEILERIPA